MLSYFKINDPFRLVPLLVLAFFLKIPALLNPTQYPEVTHWFVVGEALQGSSMYIDIWDGMASFSALIYMAFTWVFGRSTLGLLIIGTLLTFIQAVIINNFSIRAKLFESNTYLPALIYTLMVSSHPAFFTLSPSLMGLTFILLGLGKLLTHVEFRAKQDMHLIMIGLFFGVATLFYLPFIIIIPIGLILLGLFSNTILRRYFLLLFSSITPISIAFFYYWIISDHPAYFIHNYLNIGNINQYYASISWLQGVLIFGMPLLFMLVGILSFGKQRRLTNYQNRIVQLFFVLGVLMFAILMLEKPITQYSLIIFIPIATFFTVHFVALFKRGIYTMLLSLILFIMPPLLLWGISKQLIPEIYTSPDTSKTDGYRSIVKGKRIMVLGSAKDLYKEAKLAGPFYDWGLSRSFFEEMDYYDNLVFLQNQLTKSKPDLIIDLENNWDKIADRLPIISTHYYLAQPNVWARKQ